MKFLQLFRGYMRGIRLHTVVLSMMLFWAALCGCFAFGEVQHARADLNVIADAEGRNAYLLTYFPSQSDIKTGLDGQGAQELQTRLEADERVTDVFCVRTANPVSVGGEGISIVLYEPEMLSFFPKLKRIGLDFSYAPDGCVLASDLFGTLRRGDTVSLRFGREQADLPVAGCLQAPYRHPVLGISSTSPLAQDLFVDGGAVFMQSTDSVMTLLERYAKRISYSSNLIVVFEDAVDEQSAFSLMAGIAPQYQLTSFDEIITDSREEARKMMVQKLPIPVFLAITAFFSFFSIAILTFKKKQRELAYLHLCGGSVKKCGWLAFSANQASALIPLLLNSILISVWPSVPWTAIQSRIILADNFNESLLRIVQLLSRLHIDRSCLWVILVYYCVTVLISLAVTLPGMKRHTPLMYLRGVSR